MSRIQQAFERQFKGLLQDAGARRLDKGVSLLFARAEGYARTRQKPLVEATALLLADLAAKVRTPARQGHEPATGGARECSFWCDSGLGGLARWLRAAGYDASWQPHIEDRDLILHSIEHRAILLTTDSLILDRKVVRNGVLRVLWLPPALSAVSQLALVVKWLGLSPGEPRCMNCSGELRIVDKMAVQDRIPPKTARWLDEYFLCQRCGRLFWKGTHWRRISAQLSWAQQTCPPTSAERVKGRSSRSC